MKKLIILGAGIYQVPLIKKAKSLGYYTIVCSIPGNYPGFEYADKVYYDDTTDKEKILEIAQREKIVGILTTGTDVAVKTIGYVCEKMNLSGISQISAEWTTDKYLMKERFAEGDVRTAAFYKVSTLEDAKKAVENLGLPVMFKCVDKSGSRGIIKVEIPDIIESALKYSMSYTTCEYIVVEKFVAGNEIGLDGYVDRANNIKVFVPHGKIMYDNGNTKVPIGHIFPYECSQELYKDIIQQAEKAIDSLNLDRCFFNMDILIDSDKSYIIEVGGRTGATCIPELMSYHCETDIYEQMIENAVGNPVKISTGGAVVSVGELLLSEETGKIAFLDYPESELNKGEELSFDFGIGDYVKKFEVGPDRIGQLIVCGMDTNQVFERVDYLKRNTIIGIER